VMPPYLDDDDDDDNGNEKDQKKEGNDRFEQMLLSRMVKERVIFMSDEVNSETAKKVINQLLLLGSMDRKRPILLFINSPGGEVYSGLAIYDMINFIEPEVVTIASGLVASMGTTILISGPKNKRFSLPHARMMIHQPWGGIRGAAADIDIQAQEILRLKELTIDILAEKTGQTKERIQKDINRNFWMSAQEAKDYGLVDHVITSRRELYTILGLDPDLDEPGNGNNRSTKKSKNSDPKT
jgi:ATP-dependent Clp protease, protease subunit